MKDILKIITVKNKQGRAAKFYAREDTKDELIIKDVYCDNSYSDNSFSPKDAVIDIGAHIGSFAIDAAQRGAIVICFEPHPDNYRLLLQNIELNNLKDRIEPVNKAVLDTAGSFDLYIDGINSGSHSLHQQFVDNPTKERIKVDVLNFNDILVGFKKVALLKLDCEGAEYNILLSSDLKVVKSITAELHNKSRFGQIMQHLLNSGFSISGQFGKRLGKVKANK